ncbi:transcription factor Tfb4 [Myriangium duriaei CBS 260.36]|uniref:General transcription and DNA repair factor IIH subunit TFB4 n=1 Tax=Myriangium duriaei CBS 260.36 TaxID=1168546 RepID=A0A9P4IV67_9PEZI|nr:transcription factor Tfb4 [Myriangium duriaei CBS 260.36]
MNAVDATDREAQSDNGTPASLLTVILDTNPNAWALLASTLPLSKVVANLLVFINAHLAINNANKVAVLASHVESAQWLYPTPSSSPLDAPTEEDPNKYRPFAHLERTLTTNLRSLISSTDPTTLSTPATMTAGALTLALSYTSKLLSTAPPSASTTYDNTTGSFTSAPTASSAPPTSLTSRILILSVSGDLSHQYIPMMNAIFAAQRIRCPIDILKLAGDTVFLQQAADATGGVYMSLSDADKSKSSTVGGGNKAAGILQYLMQAYLPDPFARGYLLPPGQSHGVDFRAACFCHRRVVDVGFVCSICLSIFCEPLEDDTCLTCGTGLSVGNYGTKPVVVARKKVKKKKRLIGADGREGTPASGADTPGP